MPATIRLLSQTMTNKFLLHTYKIATSRGPTQKRGTRVSTVKQSTRVQTDTDTARCALGWHVMALHCTVLRARELFVLRMRTLAIQYPDPWPWGKSASLPFQTRKILHPAPGGGRWGLTLIGALILSNECLFYGAMNSFLSDE